MTTDIPDLIAGALGVSRGTAYDMMREALAEQSAQQEPLIPFRHGCKWCGKTDGCEHQNPKIGCVNHDCDQCKTAREPLTDERILSCPYDNNDMRNAFSEGWLKAEAAHGITKGNT